MMSFVKSDSMKIEVLKEQEIFLSSKDKIKKVINMSDVIAYDIYIDSILIGFVMLKDFEKGCFFLWDFAIDYKYQNKSYGTLALKELMEFMKEKYEMHTMTTTYKYGNMHAKHLYEKIGFVETDVVEEGNCHEVNMIYRL